MAGATEIPWLYAVAIRCRYFPALRASKTEG